MLQTNIAGLCGEHSQYSDHTGFAPAHDVCAFLVYTAQAPDCSAEVLSKAGRGLCVPPTSMLLRFRFLGTPQRHRLGWAGVLCTSQVWAAQCGASHHLPGPAAQFPGCAVGTLSQVGHVSPLGS